jgi:hypothetical protein
MSQTKKYPDKLIRDITSKTSWIQGVEKPNGFYHHVNISCKMKKMD